MTITTVVYHSVEAHTRVIGECIVDGLKAMPDNDVAMVSVDAVDAS
jgi:hypothetical protein